MTYPPAVNEESIRVLAVIARGHPRRTKTATHRGVAAQISALKWDEIQIAVNLPFETFGECIACLVANNYIQSGRESPGFLGRLKGEDEITFFWVTAKGRAVLSDTSKPGTTEARDVEKGETSSLGVVEAHLNQLGYGMSPLGAGAAQALLESNYSAAETASYLGVLTLALDVRQAGDDIADPVLFVPRARSMLQTLSGWKEKGLMREETFDNDAKAIYNVVTVSAAQKSWIEAVLSDPVVKDERVAFSKPN